MDTVLKKTNLKQVTMKVILTIKEGNKAEKNFCKEIELTPQEYDNLKEIARKVNALQGQECVTAYVHQV